METLTKQVEKIKKDLMDLSFEMTFGKTCEEFIKEIVNQNSKRKSFFDFL